jgi:hypothetical protein
MKLRAAVNASAVGIAMFMAACGPSPARQDLLKQLVGTKAAITTGLSMAALTERETQIRAAAELAERDLNVSQRQAVDAAIDAIAKTRAAWQLTFESCYRGDHDDEVIPLGCDGAMIRNFEALGVGKRMPIEKLAPRNQVIGPLLDVCFQRIQAAIDGLKAV